MVKNQSSNGLKLKRKMKCKIEEKLIGNEIPEVMIAYIVVEYNFNFNYEKLNNTIHFI